MTTKTTHAIQDNHHVSNACKKTIKENNKIKWSIFLNTSSGMCNVFLMVIAIRARIQKYTNIINKPNNNSFIYYPFNIFI